MEIDPLRPKTVPLSAETILWFEFLLDPELLTNHLKKASPDPSPIELIEKFLTIFPDSQVEPVTPGADLGDTINEKNNEIRLARKQIALKILTLKVASYLKWNLDVIQKNLNLPKQMQLFDDLCTLTSGTMISLPITKEIEIGAQGNQVAFEFALFIYHRWILRIYKIYREAITKNKNSFGLTTGLTDTIFSIRDERFIKVLDPMPQASIDYLTKLCENPEAYGVLTYDSLIPLTANSEYTSHTFKIIEFISKKEFTTQIHFDLCRFFLYVNSNSLAKKHAIACRDDLKDLKREYESRNESDIPFLLCDISEEELSGCLLACGVSDTKYGLLQRMNESVIHQYEGILDILKEDNLKNEIPFVHRKILELDIEGALSANLPITTRETESNVIALNTIRCLVDDDFILHNTDFMLKYPNKPNNFNILIQAAEHVLGSCNIRSRNKIKQYFLNILLTSDMSSEIEESNKQLKLFTVEELTDIKRQKYDIDIQFPLIAMQTDWKTCESKSQRLEVGALERQLINCTSANTVRKLLVKLAATTPTKPLWSINPSWTIPIPLKSQLMSLQRGFFQDFAYILLGKARELAAKNDFIGAISMLNVLKIETQRPEMASNPAIVKLGKLIAWEILLVQICHSLHEWPKRSSDNPIIMGKCKQCLMSLQNGDNIIPRMEILEYSTAMLLNLNDWNSLLLPDKRFPSLELSSAFALAALDIDKFKTNKKICREAWDLVLPMFYINPNKRNMSRDSPTLLVTSSLNPFLKKLRDPLITSIVISLLAKLYYNLKDDTNLELSADYLFLWPTNVSNANAYNIRLVYETLNNLIKQSLKYYPQNISWIKIKGDLEFANGNSEAALKCYINALITGTEYCTLHLQRPLLDDVLIRRMIKCCSNLGCYMQAAVLCQFMEEVDYALAFKSISEKTSNFSDAMDAYYSCIWDPTILEFIVNLHNKKGEHTRKLQAISYIGQLELNANNNEEIKREAAAIRKIKFLRALAKQYLL